MSDELISLEKFAKSLSDPLENSTLLKAILLHKLEKDQLFREGKVRNNRLRIRSLEIPETLFPSDKMRYSEEEYFAFRAEIIKYILSKYALLLKTDKKRIKFMAEESFSPFEIMTIENISKYSLDKIRSIISNPSMLSPKIAKLIEKVYSVTNIDEQVHDTIFVHAGNLRRRKPNANIVELNKSQVRFYLNTPINNTVLLFAKEYFKHCIDEGIDFSSKIGYESGSSVSARTILYQDLADVPKAISILEKIRREHPEIINKFGTVPQQCARINDSYYGIGHIGICDKTGKNWATYNDYIDRVSDFAFIIMKASLIASQASLNPNIKLEDKLFCRAVYEMENFYAENNADSGRDLRKFRFIEQGDYHERGKDTPENRKKWNNGLSWNEVDNRLNKILMDNPRLLESIEKLSFDSYMKRFKTIMLRVSNLAQGRDLDAKSNIAISQEMETVIKKETERDIG